MASKNRQDNPRRPCQDLISSGATFYGWLKKRSEGGLFTKCKGLYYDFKINYSY